MTFDIRTLSRRTLLQRSGLGFGVMALAHLLRCDGLLKPAAASLSPRAPGHLAPRPAHFPAKAKSVIMLLQNGGPSQIDLFDPKEELQKRHGQKSSEDIESFQPGSENDLLMGSPFRFKRRGQCGTQMSELLPNLGGVADDLCVVRSMWTENNNHPQGLRLINTGKIFLGRPTLGAWISYALGSENQNLPAYVVLRDPDGYNSGGNSLWTNGWLPAMYRGTEIQSKGSPVLNLHPARPLPAEVQRNNLKLITRLNQERRTLYPDDSRLEARIHHYELAARMQRAAEQVLDLSGETGTTRQLYGLDSIATANYGARCLMARRMVEAGVRFVLLTAPIQHGAMPWDHHSDLNSGIRKVCAQVDQPAAALIRDLKQRGLLDETIVVWTGEFGRLPTSQRGTGRDHNRFAFTTLLAGGGFRPGYVHGATDEFGYRSVEQPVGCADLLATILNQLGLDHYGLTYHHSGRDETLTDPAVSGASVVDALLA